MHTVQRRRERENRQINERLKTLIAAYKTLGGSFTGDLAVDPTHRRDFRRKAQADETLPAVAAGQTQAGAVRETDPGPGEAAGSDRRRRIRDAVEAALSDVMLLGTQEQVRLAVQAAHDMVAGRTVETARLVVSLRSFIREVLDLDPIPAELVIPNQGPVRTGGGTSARTGRNERGAGAGGGRGGQGGDGGAAGSGLHADGIDHGAGAADHRAEA
jgi:hypothetical protein